MPDSILNWFAYQHLPGHLQETSKLFHDLAEEIVRLTAPSAERTVCLRKLLEAKDAAVRARIIPNDETQPRDLREIVDKLHERITRLESFVSTDVDVSISRPDVDARAGT